MPGIAGVLAPAPSPEYESQVRSMVSAMQHQRQAPVAYEFAPEIGVYAGCTAHAGSMASAVSQQPLAGGSRLLWAGECFPLAQDPAAQLHRLYAQHGDEFVAGLNGLFAGLLIDRVRGRALLFNDRFGSERLYVCTTPGALYFASEAKALLAVLPQTRSFDETGVAHFLTFGSTLDGRTLFRGIQQTPGGSLWRIAAGTAVEQGRYFTPADWESLPALTEREFESRFGQLFGDVLPDYLQGEQPVGLSLTGGLDTRMIAACLPADHRPHVSYTYACAGSDRLLDLRIARRVAAHVGVPHHVLRVDAQFRATFAQQLDRTVHLSDGCAGVLGSHELYLSEQARALAPVRLTGNFGSEVLRSMSTFKRTGPRDELLDPAMAAAVQRTVAEQHERRAHPVTHAAFAEVPWHLFGTLAVARTQLCVRTPYLDNRIVELAYRAPPASRHTPAPALRLIHDHSAELAALPTDRGLAWGRHGFGARLQRLFCEVTFKLDYWHKEGLPDALTRFDPLLGSLSHVGLLGLHKFLAYRRWFRAELASYAAEVMSDPRTRRMPFWNPSTLAGIARDHAGGRHNRLREIHAVLTLEAVQRNLIDAAADGLRVTVS
jgi:asparagine synthase (glutamine-hydrolysing)